MNQDSPYTSITQSVYAGLNLPLNIGYHVQEHLIVNLFIKRYTVLLEWFDGLIDPESRIFFKVLKNNISSTPCILIL